ncbi:MAG: amidohydrolase family protein [Firmicutes bacterium]|mgnify:CR=1 FL=1|nr:amidohydrolase family protein [Bacillota bacterium]
MPGIIDFHTHAFPESIAGKVVKNLSSYYGAEITNSGTFSELLRQKEAAGIGRCVVHTAATKPEQVIPANKWAVSLKAAGEAAFGTIHPDFAELEEQLDFLEEKGLAGIKIHPELQGFPIDAEKLYPVYELIDRRFIVLVHLGRAWHQEADFASPERLARVLRLFPRLRVVGAHLGGYLMWDEVDCLIGQDCYLDTSSVIGYLPKERVVQLIRAHGAERVVFGSDYPMNSLGQALEEFLSLPLTDREKELILTENAERILSGSW